MSGRSDLYTFIIDTDVSLGTPGAEIDDGAALLVLAHHAPSSIQAVTGVFGNVQTHLAVQNARRLCAYLGKSSWPIYAGASSPLAQDTDWLMDWHRRYGETPAWPAPSNGVHAVTAIVQTVRANPGQVALLALGPLTNLALAVRLAPDIALKVQEVVAMGGSFESPASPEFNFRCDPEAAHIVLTAPWPLRLLGLDITGQVIFSRQDFEALPASTDAHALLKSQASGWIDTVEAQGWASGGCALHDVLAVAAVFESSLFEFIDASIEVELSQPVLRGATRVDRAIDQEGQVKVAASVNVARCREWVLNRLAGPEP